MAAEALRDPPPALQALPRELPALQTARLDLRAMDGGDLQALFGWARHTLGLRSLRADIDAANVRSLALFERLGFRRGEGAPHELAFGDLQMP